MLKRIASQLLDSILLLSIIFSAKVSICFAFPGKCIISVFVRLLSLVLPDSPEEIDPTFLLYTRDKMDTGVSLRFSDMSTLSHFDSSKSTFIIVHGLLSSGDTDWVKNMTSSLLARVSSLSEKTLFHSISFYKHYSI